MTKVAGSNPGFEGPILTISIVSAPCAVQDVRKRHKNETHCQSPNDAGSFDQTLSSSSGHTDELTKTAG